MNIGAIILAAGSSERMGRPKQLIPFRGQALILHSIHAALNSMAAPVLVVIGSNHPEIRKLYSELPVQSVINENWESGMGSSIKAGIKRLQEFDPETEGAIIMAADQPLITGDHINEFCRLLNKYDERIICARYNNILGIPTLFEVSLFQEILQIDNNHGAKGIIRDRHNDVRPVDLPVAAVDMDKPEDIQRYENS